MAFLSEYKKFELGPPLAGSAADPDSLGYVYVLAFEEPGIVKIGSAKSVGCRIAQLQAGNPFELRLHSAVSIYDVDPLLVEFAAHKLAREAGQHLRGEWFNLDADDALRCVIAAARSKRARYGSFARALKEQNDTLASAVAEREIVRRETMLLRLGEG